MFTLDAMFFIGYHLISRPGGKPNTAELNTLKYQIEVRQPFAAEINRVPSRIGMLTYPLIQQY